MTHGGVQRHALRLRPDGRGQDLLHVPTRCWRTSPARRTRWIADLTNTNFSEVKVFCSMLEIYNERVNDLLMLGQDLRLREDKSKGVFVEGLTSIEVASQQAVCDVITQGNKRARRRRRR